MGTDSYLYAKQKNGEKVILFESGNQLPFFWLLLMGKDDVFACQEKLSLHANEQSGHADTAIALNKLQALSRAAGRRDYVKQNYTPSCLALYDDWMLFMQIADFSDMKIYIDISGASRFYSDINLFTESLLRAIDGFERPAEVWYEETITGTCGREGHSIIKCRFSNLSETYRIFNQQDIYGYSDKSMRSKQRRTIPKKLWFILLIILLLALAIAGLVYFFSEYEVSFTLFEYEVSFTLF